MPNEDRNWFITERSEALASLMLTSRSDVTVESENKKDDGVDFVKRRARGVAEPEPHDR